VKRCGGEEMGSSEKRQWEDMSTGRVITNSLHETVASSRGEEREDTQ
jgi:hypothetical protein